MYHLVKERGDEKAIGECLKQLIVEMDAAIVQAIENPLVFLDGPFLSAIESRCASLAAIEDSALVSKGPVEKIDRPETGMNAIVDPISPVKSTLAKSTLAKSMLAKSALAKSAPTKSMLLNPRQVSGDQPTAPVAQSQGSDTAVGALIWEVRSRAGRLQHLLDSASQFYSTCFSSRNLDCLDYGVHGEWGQVANPTHLAIDC